MMKKIYSEIFGVALPAADASVSEKMNWENTAINEIAKTETEKVSFTGSEKQVAWVEKIVRHFFYLALSADYIEIVDYVKALRQACEDHTDSKWWIDRRDKSLRSLFPEVEEACEAGYEEDKSKEAAWAWIQSRV